MCDGTCANTPEVLQMRSDGIDKILPALIKFQTKIGTVGKNKQNPHFGSKYADLAAIMDEARPLLGENELALVQNLVESSPDEVRLLTTLYHTSGQYFSSLITLKPSKADPQGIGSAITYARRYSLSPLLGIVTEEDDDGNAASSQGNGKETQAPRGKPAEAPSRKESREAPKTPPPGRGTETPPPAPVKPKSELTLRKEKVWNTLVNHFGGDQVRAKAVLMGKTNKPSKTWTEEDLVQIEGFVQDVIDGTIVVEEPSEGGGL